MIAVSNRDIRLAWRDLSEGVGAWNIWHILAMQELRQRYRRSVLGPMWISVSLAVQVGVMGVLLGVLFKQEFVRYLPYATLGLILWNFLSASLVEGAGGFVASSTYILQAKRPLSAFIMHVLWRNLVYMAHTAVVYVGVALIFQVPLAWEMLLFIPGIVLFAINVGWILLFVGTLAARFRDVQMILQSLMQVLFWATPIMYYPEMFGRHRWVVDLNPFTHLLAVVRQPLLGEAPSLLSWSVLIGCGIVGWIATFAFFARFRARIPYWL